MIISNKNIVIGVKARDYAVSDSSDKGLKTKSGKFIYIKSGSKIKSKQSS
jgi:hypothetical protein